MLMEECIYLDKNLLIIGAGAEQVPAYILAKQKGIKTIATDSDSKAPAVELADYFLQVSTRDPKNTAEIAIEFSKKIKIHGVMTIANDVPYTVAYTASRLGLNGISTDSAMLASDKILMKKKFLEHEVACPNFYEISSFSQFHEIINQNTHLKYVLKPTDGRGARGVLIIDQDIDLHWAFNESIKWGDSGNLILEEYIEGRQFSTESFILDNVCYTPAIAERNYSRLKQFKPYIIEDGGDIPSLLSKTTEDNINQLIFKSAKAIGISSGIIKGDIVIDHYGEAKIIEIAARLSGGWLASHQIPTATGVNLVEAVMNQSLSIPIDKKDLEPRLDKSTSIRYWFPENGLITRISGEDQLKKCAGLMKYGFFRSVGDQQPIIRMHPDRFGYVMVSGKDRDETKENIIKALESINIEVE